MEKIYILISRYESSDKEFLSAHKTLNGAVKTMNEDNSEMSETDEPLLDTVTTEIENAVNRGEDLTFETDSVKYTIFFSQLWD